MKWKEKYRQINMNTKGKRSGDKIIIECHVTFHVDDGHFKTQIETHSHDDVIKLSIRLAELSQNNIFHIFGPYFQVFIDFVSDTYQKRHTYPKMVLLHDMNHSLGHLESFIMHKVREKAN